MVDYHRGGKGVVPFLLQRKYSMVAFQRLLYECFHTPGSALTSLLELFQAIVATNTQGLRFNDFLEVRLVAVQLMLDYFSLCKMWNCSMDFVDLFY